MTSPFWPLILGGTALWLLQMPVPPLIQFAKHRRAIRRRWRQFTVYAALLAVQLAVIVLAPLAYFQPSPTLYNAQILCMAVWGALMCFVPCGITFFKSGWGRVLRNGFFLTCAALLALAVI